MRLVSGFDGSDLEIQTLFSFFTCSLFFACNSFSLSPFRKKKNEEKKPFHDVFPKIFLKEKMKCQYFCAAEQSHNMPPVSDVRERKDSDSLARKIK